ncbi:UBX domain-containing protein 1-B-like isoform X1 [Hydra vulgaris]|uniref:UBX domain-containing protein 1-B-like isoform X1 n=1 Tax=Hydra vulgaris TaxID=6087 RepID=A0ABM4CGF1_HYDVU
MYIKMASSIDNYMDIEVLVSMGFDKERVEQALNATKNQGIPSALEWLFNHPVSEESAQKLGSIPTDAKSLNQSSSETSEQACAHSLKCEDCGKMLRSEMDVQAHAARTGHQNFSESSDHVKDLTEEELIEQKLRLQKKVEERRKLREIEEKEKSRAQELSRRKTGKELSQAKEELAQREIKRIAEEKRKEKIEEKRLREKLKEDIAKDRADFKAKQKTSLPLKNNSIQSPVVLLEKKECNVCAIQFRLTNGVTIKSTFGADETLSVVRDFISLNRTDGSLPFSLSTSFPRKVFCSDDMTKTLRELDLIPTAVLILTR